MSAARLPDLSIDALETGSIDPEAFDHEAHIYLGWLYLERFEIPEAIRRFSTALRKLTEELGVPDKYHETITWFYLLLLAERRLSSPSQDWFSFRRENDDLFGRGDRSILFRYYNRATLADPGARRVFVLPDRLATVD